MVILHSFKLDMKIVKLLILFVITLSSFSQQYITRDGITEFDGSKAAFEPIKAKNNSSISIIDIENGGIAALIYIKDFNFRLGLMQEHFNENYLESNKFPKSTFEGDIKDFDLNKLTNDFKNYYIKGKLTIKGVTQIVNTEAQLRLIDEKIELKCNFNILLSDFKIKIPRVVFKKIDEKVKINLNFKYEKNNKS